MRSLGVALAAFAGCSAACEAGPSAPAGAAEHATYTVWIEPPLAAPADASLAHESGYAWRGVSAATSVTFSAPEGPCTLTLTRGGQLLAEAPLKLVEGVREYELRRRP